jgi:L-ribulose-5-phosphate 3-epimerase
MKSAPRRGVLAGTLRLAKALGFDFVEMSVDETDARLARLDWSREQRLALVNAIAETGVRVPSVPERPSALSAR